MDTKSLCKIRKTLKFKLRNNIQKSLRKKITLFNE